MSSEQAFADQVRERIIARARDRRPIGIVEVADELFMSRSTMQRRLAAADTSFTEVRCRARVEVALRQLTSGVSCAAAAAEVGLTADHLCRIVTERTGLRPREIARAQHLAARAHRWRRVAPPRSGSRLYRERTRRWQALEAELGRLLEPIPPSGHPLSAWARRARDTANRPDYRTGGHRRRVRAARGRERRLREAERRRVDAWWADFQRRDGRHPSEIVSLANLDDWIDSHLAQIRVTRISDPSSQGDPPW